MRVKEVASVSTPLCCIIDIIVGMGLETTAQPDKKKKRKKKIAGSGGIRTHAIEMTGA